MERWALGATRKLDTFSGLEVFVVRGVVNDRSETRTRWDWVRLPIDARFNATAGAIGARGWSKAERQRRVTERAV